MASQDPGNKGPQQRRMVLRKIARPQAAHARPLLELADAGPDSEVEVESLQEDAITLIEPSPAPPPAPAPPVEPVPAPRTVAQSHSSVPPSVATVVTPLGTMLDAPPRERMSSSWRGVLGGGVLGLAIVGAFVVGAQIAHRSTSPAPAVGATVAAQPATKIVLTAQPTAPAPPPPLAAPAVVELPAAAPASAAVPVVAATALPAVRAPAARPVAAGVVAPSRAPAAAVAAAPQAPPAAASAQPAAPAAASAAEAQAAPADSAPSLVPVIPPSPVVVDPLVKAVQDDIEEEKSSRGK